MRLRSGPTRLYTLLAVFGVAVLSASAPVSLAQEATPAAGTPVVELTPAPAAEPTAAPAAPAAQPVTTDVVTLVAWYLNDPSGEFLNILPLQAGEDRVASAPPDAAPIGRAEFPSPEVGLPFITIADTTFNAYLRYEFDVAERWIWFDDTEGVRPATLVIQVQGADGPYANYYGTATFVSRDDAAGGVVILALRPPDAAPEAAPAADEAAPAEAAPEEAPAEEAPVEGEAEGGA